MKEKRIEITGIFNRWITGKWSDKRCTISVNADEWREKIAPLLSGYIFVDNFVDKIISSLGEVKEAKVDIIEELNVPRITVSLEHPCGLQSQVLDKLNEVIREVNRAKGEEGR
jgi:hypothetical protein